MGGRGAGQRGAAVVQGLGARGNHSKATLSGQRLWGQL